MVTKIRGAGVEFPAGGTQTRNANARPVNTAQKIIHNVEALDTHNFYNNVTGRFQPTIAGWYEIRHQVRDGTGLSAGIIQAIIRKNDNNTVAALSAKNDGGGAAAQASDIVYMNGADDYVEFQCYQNSGNAMGIVHSNAANSFISIVLVKAD